MQARSDFKRQAAQIRLHIHVMYLGHHSRQHGVAATMHHHYDNQQDSGIRNNRPKVMEEQTETAAQLLWQLMCM